MLQQVEACKYLCMCSRTRISKQWKAAFSKETQSFQFQLVLHKQKFFFPRFLSKEFHISIDRLLFAVALKIFLEEIRVGGSDIFDLSMSGNSWLYFECILMEELCI